MVCFHPIDAWRVGSSSDGYTMHFHEPRHAPFRHSIERMKVPCGQCVGCRLERSRQWAIRCMHEAQMHTDNCFITLTFSPEALAARGNQWSLDVRDFQLFMKRLRKRFGSGIRFYHCGEYGSKNKRPHYHACIFGFDFPDKRLWKITPTGHRLYVSDILNSLWSDPDTGISYGFSTIGDVTFESAAYVARYIMKKINGDAAKDHYEWVDDVTGEVFPLKPEYTTMSRRPGIGKTWLDKFEDDVYPHDFVVVNGTKMRPPKYYDRQFEAARPFEFEEIKAIRLENADKHIDNNTPARLNVREAVQKAKLNLLPRSDV